MKPLPTLAAVCGCLILTACHPSKEPHEEPSAQVSGQTVTLPSESQRTSLTIEKVVAETPSAVTFTGRLAWNDDVTARVFSPFAGRVRTLPVAVNSPINRGEALAAIESPDFHQASADFKKAESDCRRSEKNLRRTRELFEHGAAPQKDLETAESDFADASAEKERAQARLAIYAVNETVDPTNPDFLLPSPVSGVLVERNATPGQEVRPDQMLANVPQYASPLFIVTDPRRLWVWLDVTETQLSLVRAGQKLIVHSKAFPGRQFEGRLDLIGGSLDPTTRMIRVRGVVDNSENLLKAELYVTVELPETADSSVQIPSKSVFLLDNQYYVFVETGPGKYERRAIAISSERDGKITAIGGLKEGQRLVTEGCLLLQEVINKGAKI